MEKIKKYGWFLFFLSLGLLIFCYQMFVSGFDLMPCDGYSAKTYNYVLEHSYLWLLQKPLHSSLWNLPVCYPSLNTLANFDSLIGIYPIYWIIRLLIHNPFSAFQVLFIVLCVLNYSTFYWFLRRLKFSYLASSFSSFIFAFSIMRMFRSLEIPYLSQFLTVLAMIFILKVNKNNDNIKNHFCFLLASIFLILQFYSCFALGFFSVFVLFFGVLFSLLPKTSRDVVADFFKNFYKMILFYSFVVGLMLLPMAYHFSLLGKITGLNNLLSIISDGFVWIRSVSILDSAFTKNLPYMGFLKYNEAACSLGIFTMIFALFGIYKMKYAKGLPVLILFFIFLISCNYTAIYFWKLFYYIIPSTEGLEALNRVSFVALIVFCILICYSIKFFEEVQKNKLLAKIALGVILLVLVLEQIPFKKDINSYWKNYCVSKSQFQKDINEIVSKIPDDVKVIKIEYVLLNEKNFGEIDLEYKKNISKKITNTFSMWSALKKGVYSADGCIKSDEQQKEIKDVFVIKKEIDLTKI